MFGKKMTAAEAEAALQAEAAKNQRKAERGEDKILTCEAGHIRYAGTRGSGCDEPGCRH